MPVRYPGVLLVIVLSLFHDMSDCSPVGKCSHSSWNVIKDHARDLNDIAFQFYNSTEAMKDLVLDEIPRIECHHHCGPKHLIVDEKTCLQRIVRILSYYKNILSELKLDSRQDIERITEMISALLERLEDCGYKMSEDQHVTIPSNTNTDQFVLDHIGYPLVSATSLIARVFSPGNPNDHIKAISA